MVLISQLGQLHCLVGGVCIRSVHLPVTSAARHRQVCAANRRRRGAGTGTWWLLAVDGHRRRPLRWSRAGPVFDVVVYRRRRRVRAAWLTTAAGRTVMSCSHWAGVSVYDVKGSGQSDFTSWREAATTSWWCMTSTEQTTKSTLELLLQCPQHDSQSIIRLQVT